MQLQSLAPARAREVVAGGLGAVDDLVLGVLLVGVDPAALELLGIDHFRSPASFLRGPANVAFMRAAWPWVNMNIAASST